ncbi:MAG: EF-P beta-lysylation protein EpmB [Gammaproteobacteria bacterium]
MTTIIQKKSDWQTALLNLITDPSLLFEILELDPSYLDQAHKATTLFPLKTTHSFVARMEKSNVNDPLLLQVLPLFAEFSKNDNFTNDPLSEMDVNPIPGLLHKYHGRVLLTLTGSCAVNCRFCFRRHFPYKENMPGTQGFKHIMNYISKDPSINEVILSGGDPLNVNDNYLKKMIGAFSEIKHLKRVRIHSRLPIVLPERITQELMTVLTSTRLKTIMVLHCNHPNEIDEQVQKAVSRLYNTGIPILNQTVLLKKINDNAETLCALSEKLFDSNITPYYLHLPDKVAGTIHFYVSKEFAKQIYREMIQTLPGYMVPKLVEEIPGIKSKQIIDI